MEPTPYRIKYLLCNFLTIWYVKKGLSLIIERWKFMNDQKPHESGKMWVTTPEIYE
jgi:hypothetical protein